MPYNPTDPIADQAIRRDIELIVHEDRIRSLKRQGNSNSEVFIKGPETETISRLVLDDYSATLLSSSPQTFAAIDAEIARGHQLADAIARSAFPDHD